jgi:hypothetical protein
MFASVTAQRTRICCAGPAAGEGSSGLTPPLDDDDGHEEVRDAPEQEASADPGLHGVCTAIP